MDPLESAVNEVLASLGFELVEFRRAGSPQRPLLQVRIDRPGMSDPAASVADQSITSDDCVRASRAIEQSLEGRGLVGTEYTLEVSSPGSDRPLRRMQDWIRFRGERVKVKHRDLHGSKYGVVEAHEAGGADEAHERVAIRAEDGGELLILSLDGMRDARLAPDLRPKPKPGKAARRKDGK